MAKRVRTRPKPEDRDPRGGPRQGVEGKNYAQRSDLQAGPRQAAQPIRAVPSQGYGQRAAQEASQAAVPLPQARPFTGPDDIPSFSQSTGRPDEPLTAGLPFGPGRNPGPMDRPIDPTADGVGDRLRALYLTFPTAELRELIEDMEVGD